MSRLFAGFDGGGSKTACVLCDGNGTPLGEGFGGPSNFRYCGEDVARKSMTDALASAFAAAGLKPSRLKRAYVSNATIPTYGGDKYVDFFAGCVDAERLTCEGDLYPIWYGEAGDDPAVVLIAGTGSVAYLFRGKTTVRAGGWGPYIGDEGSGYDIGVNALRTIMRMYDGRLEEDRQFIAEVSPQDNLRMLGGFFAGASRSDIAALAGKVMKLAESGNPTAISLVRRASDEIMALVRAVTQRDGNADRLPLILSGGLMYEGSPMLGMVRDKARELSGRISEVKRACHKPSYISAALALRAEGLHTASKALLEGSVSRC